MTVGETAQGLARRRTDQPDVASSGQPRVRVILAEDDVLLREGMASLLTAPGSTSSARRVTRCNCADRS